MTSAARPPSSRRRAALPPGHGRRDDGQSVPTPRISLFRLPRAGFLDNPCSSSPSPRQSVPRRTGGFFFPSVVFLPTSVTSPPAHAHTVGCRAAATDERAAEPSPAPPADASSSPQLPPPHLAPLSNALGGNYTLPPPPPPEDARIEAEGYRYSGRARVRVFIVFSHVRQFIRFV